MPAIRLWLGRTRSSVIGSGDIRYWVIVEGHGLAFGPRQIGAGRRAGLGLWVPRAQVFEDASDNTDFVYECDDAHGGAALRAPERVDRVDFLDQPGPVGLATGVDGRLVDAD